MDSRVSVSYTHLFCWGCYGVCVELTRSSGCTNLQVTRKVFFWGLVFTAPLLALLRPDLSPAHLAAPDLLFNVLYLGVGASAICFVLWNKALSLLGSVSTNVYIYLTPVSYTHLTNSSFFFLPPLGPGRGQ